MKKLGLIGGIGPESTIEYYRSIEYGVQKKSGQNFFPNITIESLNVFDVLNLCKKQDYDGLTDYLLNGINQLSAAGVQYAGSNRNHNTYCFLRHYRKYLLYRLLVW